MLLRNNCPLCGAPTADALLFVTSTKGYEFWECPSCSLVYGLCIPDEKDVAATYGQDYADHYDDGTLRRQIRAYADRFFSRRIPGRLLEIGCGNGHLLRRLKELGYDVVGVELNAASAWHAWDLPITTAAFEDLPVIYDAFDEVVTFHVLEHIAKPVAFAAKIGQFLTPGGRWFNYMPNVRAWKLGVHGPAWLHFNPQTPTEHVNFFDEWTVRELASRAGLAITGQGADSDDFWTEFCRTNNPAIYG